MFCVGCCVVWCVRVAFVLLLLHPRVPHPRSRCLFACVVCVLLCGGSCCVPCWLVLFAVVFVYNVGMVVLVLCAIVSVVLCFAYLVVFRCI